MKSKIKQARQILSTASNMLLNGKLKEAKKMLLNAIKIIDNENI